MRLRLVRDTFGPLATLGKLYIGGNYQCDTLEDTYRQLDDGTVDKIKGRTAIARGLYDVVIDFSPKFGKPMPHILDVPQFEGIRIHAGNTDADTEGCVLVGTRAGPDLLVNSRLAFDAFFAKLQAALQSGDTATIEVA